MSERLFRSAGVVTYGAPEQQLCYITPELSNIFAGFLLGYVPKDTAQTKHVEMYAYSANDYLEKLLSDDVESSRKIVSVPVRINSMTQRDGNYYAKFICTFDGALFSYSNTYNSFCLVLKLRDGRPLAVANFDEYDKLIQGDRVDVSWELGITHSEVISDE